MANTSTQVIALDATFEEVILSGQQKQLLFSEAVSSLRKNAAEADLILANLQRMAPELPQAFVKRTADSILNTPFRLIRQCANIEKNQSLSYLCISYCWRGQDFDARGLSSAMPFPFGQPFLTAILDQRTSPKEGIWLDQLCIRQDDEMEKLKAIATMDVVYKSCRRLIVLLEDAWLDEDEVAVLKKYDSADPKNRRSWNPDPEDLDALVSCYTPLTYRWCFHEFAVAEPWNTKRYQHMHSALFVMGSVTQPGGTVTATWMTIQAVLGGMMLRYPDRVGSNLGAPGTAFMSGLENERSPLNDPSERRLGSQKSSILAKFHAVMRTNCSVQQDRLSIMLHLSSLGLAVAAKIPDDMVELAAVAVSLAAGEKAALTFVNPEPTYIGGKESWLMKHHADRDITLRKFVLGGNGGIRHIGPERLEIDLLIFNRALAPLPTRTDIAFTRKVFPDEIVSTQPPLQKGQTAKQVATTLSDSELDPLRRQFLANAMRLGLQFISRLWRTIDRDVIQESFNWGPYAPFAANETLRDNAENLRNLSSDPSALSQKDALLFITWLTDPRSMYYLSAFSSILPCTGAGDAALLTSAIIRKGFIGKQIRLAVPKDLVGHSCHLPRVWFLSPVEGSESNNIAEGYPWHLLGKALLLGEPDLEAEMRRDVLLDQKGVFLAKRQVVQW